jgi:hypothetical protein
MTSGASTFMVLPPQVQTVSLGYVLPSKKKQKHSGGMADPRGPVTLPYPRNHRERRTYNSIENRLPELIKKAEQKFGPRYEGLESEWNGKFWEMVIPTRDRDHFLKTKK